MLRSEVVVRAPGFWEKQSRPAPSPSGEASRCATRQAVSRTTYGSPGWRVTAVPVGRAPGPGEERAPG